MQIGVVFLSPSLLFLIGIGAASWALLKFRWIPRAELAAGVARGADTIACNIRLITLRALRSIAIAIAIAPACVSAILVGAQLVVEKGQADPQKLQSVVAMRGFIERTLGTFTDVALSTWIIALLVIGAIWFFARRSSSRRRWTEALDARRRAYKAALAGDSFENVMAAAETADAGRLQKLRFEGERISNENRRQIELLESVDVVELPANDGSKIKLSVTSLRTAIEQLQAEASTHETGSTP